MKSIEGLTDAQWQYICSKIPAYLAKDFFNKHPKDFQRLEKGFRAKSLSDRQVENILVRYRRDPFIRIFLIRFIEVEIEHITTTSGQQREDYEIYIERLSDSIFSEKVDLFYQLIEEEPPREYIQLMEAAVRREKHYTSQLKEMNKEKSREDREREDVIQSLENELLSGEQEEIKLRESLNDLEARLKGYEEKVDQKDEVIVNLSSAVEELKEKWDCYKNKEGETVKRLEETLLYCEDLEEKFKKLRAHTLQLEESMGVLRKEYGQTVEDMQVLLESYRKDERSDQGANRLEVSLQWPHKEPVRPQEMEIFEEFFEYNLKSMGFKESDPTYDLFLQYIESVAFTGVPLLVKTFQGINLANCLANTLSGKSTAVSIHYSYEMSLIDFKSLLDNLSERVWCIHNVIGSAEELNLLTLLSHYRDKIIIVTYPAERTLFYVPPEVLNYAHYINFDGYDFMARIQKLKEDPSALEEDIYEEDEKTVVAKKQSILLEIGKECGLSEEVVRSMITSLEDGDALDATLLFTLLPYASKVLGINPYVESKRLNQYAGVNGKSLQKKSMLEWFSE